MAWKMGIPLKSPKLVAHAAVCAELETGRNVARRVRDNRDPKSFLPLAKKCREWFEGAESRLAEHIAPCSQLERFLCAFDADALEYDKSEGSGDVDRAPPARRRTSAMMGHLLDRLADLLEAVENAPEDTEVRDAVDGLSRADLDNVLVCIPGLIQAKHEETAELLKNQGGALTRVEAHSEYLFHSLAGDELKTDLKRLLEKYGPRFITTAAHVGAAL